MLVCLCVHIVERNSGGDAWVQDGRGIVASSGTKNLRRTLGDIGVRCLRRLEDREEPGQRWIRRMMGGGVRWDGSLSVINGSPRNDQERTRKVQGWSVGVLTPFFPASGGLQKQKTRMRNERMARRGREGVRRLYERETKDEGETREDERVKIMR